jgi:excisionase family DNA binding protein
MTVIEAAKKLKLTRQRVTQLIADGRIKAKRFGRMWDVVDLSRAVKRNKAGRPKGK